MTVVLSPLSVLGYHIGDACVNDYDGDNITNNEDTCPLNKGYSKVNFNRMQLIPLDPKEESQIDPVWIIYDKVIIHI